MAQLSAAGQPALIQQSAIWRTQFATAIWQPLFSLQVGRGWEHQLPHPYSQVGAGAVVVHLLADEVVDVVDVVFVVE